ncbi:MAG: hypothetical protein WCR23_10635, partial [Planctomycetota bacterium]
RKDKKEKDLIHHKAPFPRKRVQTHDNTQQSENTTTISDASLKKYGFRSEFLLSAKLELKGLKSDSIDQVWKDAWPSQSSLCVLS